MICNRSRDPTRLPTEGDKLATYALCEHLTQDSMLEVIKQTSAFKSIWQVPWNKVKINYFFVTAAADIQTSNIVGVNFCYNRSEVIRTDKAAWKIIFLFQIMTRETR